MGDVIDHTTTFKESGNILSLKPGWQSDIVAGLPPITNNPPTREPDYPLTIPVMANLYDHFQFGW